MNADGNDNYPLPPLVQVSSDFSTTAGQPVVVRLRTSDVRRGRMIRFDSVNSIVELKEKEQPSPVSISFQEIKLLQSMGPASWSPVTAPVGQPDARVPLVSEERDFEVEFTDGDRLRGKTRGFREESSGLYLFPVKEGRLGFFSCPATRFEAIVLARSWEKR